MVAPYIENWDTGAVARQKINGIIDEVNASIPSIWENGNWYIGGVDTGINAGGYEIRQNNNLIKNINDEIFTDLQFGDNLTPAGTFPIGVTVGYVNTTDGWAYSWLLINARTTNKYARVLYTDSGDAYFDPGNGAYRKIATTVYVDNAIQALRNELSTVAFTGKSSDLNNDAQFNSVPVLTEDEYDIIPDAGGNDKRYFIYEEVNE